MRELPLGHGTEGFLPVQAVNPVPRTYVRGFGAPPLGEVQNIHPRTHMRGVLWYGVNGEAPTVQGKDPVGGKLFCCCGVAKVSSLSY